jgi:hypothetical protein
MASTRDIHLTFHCVTAEYVIELVTAALRTNNWTPDRAHPCGCAVGRLCLTHAEIRAVEHYHPGGAA